MVNIGTKVATVNIVISTSRKTAIIERKMFSRQTFLLNSIIVH